MGAVPGGIWGERINPDLQKRLAKLAGSGSIRASVKKRPEKTTNQFAASAAV
jgi:hypothetical protein